jgi:MoaA/NifB/PqqE/SkfB family radical SAM enzyme
MSWDDIDEILTQALSLGYIRTIYFEGGEPFLYYPILVRGVQQAFRMGFEVGIVTNGYWATTARDAELWLSPFAGQIMDLSISSDLYHYDREMSEQAERAVRAAETLSIPVGVISVPQPCDGQEGLMYRGRAAEKLACQAAEQNWRVFTECPYEDFVSPGRVHIDPFGYIHLCQGILVGNIHEKSLGEIFQKYDYEGNPVIGPLHADGPAGLARAQHLTLQEGFADACHCCYKVREQLRDAYPHILGPDAVYGIY